MIKYDEKHGIGQCPTCGEYCDCVDGDCIEDEMWETYYCHKCKRRFSERYEVTYLGYDTYDNKAE